MQNVVSPFQVMHSTLSALKSTFQSTLTVVSVHRVVAGSIKRSAIHQVSNVRSIDRWWQFRSRSMRIRSNALLSEMVPYQLHQSALQTSPNMFGKITNLLYVLLKGSRSINFKAGASQVSGWLMAFPALFIGVPSGK